MASEASIMVPGVRCQVGLFLMTDLHALTLSRVTTNRRLLTTLMRNVVTVVVEMKSVKKNRFSGKQLMFMTISSVYRDHGS